ncbi:MAG: LysR substrate-binding domain-containing protein, partial [Holophagaceae bacterium]
AGSGLEFQTVETIKRCVEVGLGVAPLPRMAVAEDLRTGRLVALPWAGEPIRISTFLVWNPQRHLGSAEVAFLACVRRMVPSSL